VVGVNDLKVVQRAAGANMSVDVGGGQAYIDGTEGATQAMYSVTSTSTVVNLAVAASSPTLPRIDIVVAKVQDQFYSGGTNAWSLAVVTGTPAASPVAPAAPANSLILANIAVAANATTVVNANITDKRPLAHGSMYTGPFVCTSATRPANPWQGMEIYETDTGLTWLYNGSVWINFSPPFWDENVNTTNSSNYTTTEIVTDTLTTTIVTGKRYRLVHDAPYQSTVAGDNSLVRIREDNLTGTQLQIYRFNIALAATDCAGHCEALFTAAATGAKTFVITNVRSGGTGTLSRRGSATTPSNFTIQNVK